MKAVPTYKEALDAAAQAIIAAANDHGVEMPIPSILAEVAVRAYLPRHREIDRARVGGHYSDNTRDIARLQPGETVVLPVMAPQSLHGRFRSARGLLGNERASWAWEPLPSGEWLVQRLPDGMKPPRALKSPITLELASMKVGDTWIAKSIKTIRGKGSLGSNHRIIARAYLGEPGATWQTRATNQGIRLTRVA